MCKEMLVIPVNRVVVKKILVRKSGGLRESTGTRVCLNNGLTTFIQC
jgi:hypothetical protein